MNFIEFIYCSFFHGKHKKPLYYLGLEMFKACQLCDLRLLIDAGLNAGPKEMGR